MLTFQIHSADVAAFLAILLRLSLVLFIFPLFSGTQIPALIKAAVALVLSTMLYPVLRSEIPPISFDPARLLWTLCTEILFAMLLAFSLQVILAAFDFAGELISYQMGLSFVQVADPQSGGSSAIISSLLRLLVLLLFFSVNGHHILLKALVASFHLLPVGEFALHSLNVGRAVLLSGQIFVLAVKLSAPVMVVMMLAQVGFGLLAKFVPNLNVLVTSFPITITLGLIFMGLSLFAWANTANHYSRELTVLMDALTRPSAPAPAPGVQATP